MKVPIMICNLKETPIDSNIKMEVLGLVNNKKAIVRDTTNNRIYEEYTNHIDNESVPEAQYGSYRVSIRDKYLERFYQTDYKVIGYTRDGRVKLEDQNGEVIETYVSRLIFKDYV